MSYSSLTNKQDGVVTKAEDNKEPIGTDPDAAADDAEYRQDINIAGIKAGKNSGYKGPGNTSFGIKDPRFA